jgi:hypothetical protein
MWLPLLTNNRGALYPSSIVFFLSALILLAHGLSVYSIQYKTYDGLENMHRHATIQLLMEIEKQKMP